MTPVQAFRKSKEKVVFSNLQDKREKHKHKPKYELGVLVRTADIKKIFSKGDSTTWSYNLYTTTEIIHDIIPSCRIIYLSERYNENLLRTTELVLEENFQVLKELNQLNKLGLNKWN